MTYLERECRRRGPQKGHAPERAAFPFPWWGETALGHAPSSLYKQRRRDGSKFQASVRLAALDKKAQGSTKNPLGGVMLRCIIDSLGRERGSRQLGDSVSHRALRHDLLSEL